MSEPQEKKPKHFQLDGGRIYFTPGAERRFFFVLTLVMLALGAAAKFGWIG